MAAGGNEAIMAEVGGKSPTNQAESMERSQCEYKNGIAIITEMIGFGNEVESDMAKVNEIFNVNTVWLADNIKVGRGRSKAADESECLKNGMEKIEKGVIEITQGLRSKWELMKDKLSNVMEILMEYCEAGSDDEDEEDSESVLSTDEGKSEIEGTEHSELKGGEEASLKVESPPVADTPLVIRMSSTVRKAKVPKYGSALLRSNRNSKTGNRSSSKRYESSIVGKIEESLLQMEKRLEGKINGKCKEIEEELEKRLKCSKHTTVQDSNSEVDKGSSIKNVERNKTSTPDTRGNTRRWENDIGRGVSSNEYYPYEQYDWNRNKRKENDQYEVKRIHRKQVSDKKNCEDFGSNKAEFRGGNKIDVEGKYDNKWRMWNEYEPVRNANNMLYDGRSTGAIKKSKYPGRDRNNGVRNDSMMDGSFSIDERVAVRKQYKALLINYFRKDITAEDVVGMINHLNKECEVAKLDSNNRWMYASFVVTYEKENSDLFEDRNLWPRGVGIKEFIGRPKYVLERAEVQCNGKDQDGQVEHSSI